MRKKKHIFAAGLAAALALALTLRIPASSHREALAILNEPCADNTDTFGWVNDGSHDKLYLIMDFNPLHEPNEPGQGAELSHELWSEVAPVVGRIWWLIHKLVFAGFHCVVRIPQDHATRV